MRSAGCIVNDILDKEFDKKVFRTKNRPIASNQISVGLAIFYVIILCLFAFFVLLNFNTFTIILALGSMPLAFYVSFDEKIYLLATTIFRNYF